MENFVAQMDLYAVIVMGFMLMVGTVGVGYALFSVGKIVCQHLNLLPPAPVRLNTYCKNGSEMHICNI